MASTSAVPFFLLDATDTSITLIWDREPGNPGRSTVEEVQMRRAASPESPGPDVPDATDAWDTLSSNIKSGALRKKNLEPGKAYIFRRRSRQVEAAASSSGSSTTTGGHDSVPEENWGPWSAESEPCETLRTGVQQGPVPAIKMRESSAVVVEWPPVPDATAYEVQMGSMEGGWQTISPGFKSTLLRKKGLQVGKQYRFRVRPLFESEGTLEWGWSPASPPASPAVLNSLLATLPSELVGAGPGAPAVPRDSLAGKVVGFYFSAAWCGPCRRYTPQLAELYRKAKAQHKAFEIIFVSLDSDQQSMAKYHAGMPWPAVPFEHNFREQFASDRNVNSIPRLLMTGRNGQDISSNAVGMTWDQLMLWESQG